MAVFLSPVGGVAAQFFTNSGAVLTGGKLYSYAAGTTTPVATYTSSSGSISQANPIILDAAGRVPSGEIWLTDGVQYKFVLMDSNNVLIATYDNIIGINSNFINFTNQEEIQTATAGQTVFTLTTMQYQPATGSLSVFVDGVNQYGPGASYAYAETSSTVVTFVSGLHVGASVKFTTSATNASSYGNATQISYTEGATGAAPRSVANKLQESVSVLDFIPNGVNPGTDVTTYINNAFTALTSTGGNLYFPKGTYKISSILQVPNGVNIFGDGMSSIIKCLNYIPRGIPNGDAQGQCISMGGHNFIKDMYIDGGGFNNGGILVSNQTDVLIDNVWIVNSVAGAQAIQLSVAYNVMVTNCTIVSSTNGIQLFKCLNILITNCRVSTCSGGGIFMATCQQVTVTGCIVNDCGDVGLDIEGGISCTFTGNFVTRCNNGEITLFLDASGTLGCINLNWIGNTVHRQATYTNTSGSQVGVNTSTGGAILISSISANAENIVFSNNAILVDSGGGQMWQALTWGAYNNDVTISNNVFTSYSTSQPWNTPVNAQGLKYVNNIHNYYATIGNYGLFKNVKNGVISGNKFFNYTTQSTQCIYLYSDLASQQSCYFTNNEFYGWGDNAVYMDQYVSGLGTYILSGNKFTFTPTANGGFTVNSASGHELPTYIDQKLLISLTDSTNATIAVNLANYPSLVSGTYNYTPFGEFLLNLDYGSIDRNLYKLLYLSGTVASMNGTGSASGAAASTNSYISSISGTTMNITKPAPTQSNTYFTITLNSPFA